MTAGPVHPGISLASAAGLVRAAVKAAADDGTLALRGYTANVLTEDDSASTSIDFHVGNAPGTCRLSVLSPECRAFEDELRAALTGIACRYYTPDSKHRFVTVSFDHSKPSHYRGVQR